MLPVNRVEFAGTLENFPGAGKASRCQECIAGPERRFRSIVAANDNNALEDVAELGFGEDDTPCSDI